MSTPILNRSPPTTPSSVTGTRAPSAISFTFSTSPGLAETTIRDCTSPNSTASHRPFPTDLTLYPDFTSNRTERQRNCQPHP